MLIIKILIALKGFELLVNLRKKQMKLFEDFKIKFEKPDWSRNLELGLIDAILELHPRLVAFDKRRKAKSSSC